MTAPTGLLRLNTDNVPERQRREFICEYYGRISMGLDIAPKQDSGVRVDVAALVLPGDVLVGSGFATSLASRRTPELLADGNEAIVLSCSSSGYRAGRAGGNDVESAPGDVMAVSLGTPIHIENRDTDMLSVQIGRNVLAGALPELDLAAPMAIRADAPGMQLLLGFAGIVLRTQPEGAAERELAARHIVDLAAHVLRGGFDLPFAAPSVRAARLAAAKAYVAANLQWPNLSVKTIAAHLGVTPRYVHRLFEGEEASLTEYIQVRRLDRARDLLSDPQFAGQRIADIAFASGFSDLSTFNRLMRKRFGRTPTDIRAGH